MALTAAVGLAFHPHQAGTLLFWGILLVSHVLLAAYVAATLHREKRLRRLLRPRFGDLSLGALAGLGLLLASWAGREALARVGSPEQAWLFNIYLQIGDPEAFQASFLLTTFLVVIVACEELIWRGWVLTRTTQAFGQRRGWIIAALLYAVPITPTLLTLKGPVAGPNPLLLGAALLCGLVWSFMAHLIGRLPPVLVSHLIFSYFSIVQFHPPGF